jgi:hypothetical protein
MQAKCISEHIFTDFNLNGDMTRIRKSIAAALRSASETDPMEFDDV